MGIFEQARDLKTLQNSIITGILEAKGASVTRIDPQTIRVQMSAQYPGEADTEFTVTIKAGR